MSSGTDLEYLNSILKELQQDGGASRQAPVIPPAEPRAPAEPGAPAANNTNNASSVSSANSDTSSTGMLAQLSNTTQQQQEKLKANGSVRPPREPFSPLAEITSALEQNLLSRPAPSAPAPSALSSPAPAPSAPSDEAIKTLAESTSILQKDMLSSQPTGQPKPAEPAKPAEPPKPVEPPKPAESPKPAEPPKPVEKPWYKRFQVPKFPSLFKSSGENKNAKPEGYQASKEFPGDPELPPILNMLEEYIQIIPENEAYLSQSSFNNLNNGNCWKELPALFGVQREEFPEKLPILQRYFGVWHKPYMWSSGKPRPAIFEDPMCYPGEPSDKMFIERVFKTRLSTLRTELNTMRGSGILPDNLHFKRKELQVERIEVFLKSLQNLKEEGTPKCEPIPRVKFGFYVDKALQGIFKQKCDCMKELKQLTDLVLLTMILLSEADQEEVRKRLRKLDLPSLLSKPESQMDPKQLQDLGNQLRKLLQEMQQKAPEELKSVLPELKTMAAKTNRAAEEVRNNTARVNAQRGGALEEQKSTIQSSLEYLQNTLANLTQQSAQVSKEDKEKIQAFLDAYKPLKGVQFPLPLSESDRTKIQTLLKAHQELQSIDGYKGLEIGQTTLQELLDFQPTKLSANLSRSIPSYDMEEKINASLDGTLEDEADQLTTDEKEILDTVKDLEMKEIKAPFSPETDETVKKLLGLESNETAMKHIDKESLNVIKDVVKVNTSWKRLQDFKVPEVALEELETAVSSPEPQKGMSTKEVQQEIEALKNKQQMVESELNELPAQDAVSAPAVIPGATEEDQLLNEIAVNLDTIKKNYNPFNEVLALLSIDKELTDKIKAYLGNPTQEGLNAIDEVLKEDEKEAESVLTYLRILLSYQLEAIESIEVDSAIKEDILSLFKFSTQRDTTKELRELLQVFEQLFVHPDAQVKSLLEPTLVEGRESVIVQAVDENPYLKGLLEAKEVDSSNAYPGAKQNETFSTELVPFLEDTDNIFTHIIAFVQDNSLKLRRYESSEDAMSAWKQAKGLPLNILILRFLQLLKQKFQ